MQSRISIDVDQDNQPIIKIEYKESSDVRDKLVKKFLETFGTESSWSTMKFLPDSPYTSDPKTILITPVPAHLIKIEAEAMYKRAEFNPTVE